MIIYNKICTDAESCLIKIQQRLLDNKEGHSSYRYDDEEELKEIIDEMVLKTNKIVKNNARTKAELAEAFNDFVKDPYMNFIFDVNSHPFGTRATIIPVVEVADGTSKILRNVYYNNLKDFLMTDLFEGYIHGHYLWRCDI